MLAVRQSVFGSNELLHPTQRPVCTGALHWPPESHRNRDSAHHGIGLWVGAERSTPACACTRASAHARTPARAVVGARWLHRAGSGIRAPCASRCGTRSGSRHVLHHRLQPVQQPGLLPCFQRQQANVALLIRPKRGGEPIKVFLGNTLREARHLWRDNAEVSRYPTKLRACGPPPGVPSLHTP